MNTSGRFGTRPRRSNYLAAVLEILEPRILLDGFDDWSSSDDSDYSAWPTADTQPADTQPADTQPADTQPAATQPSDTQPSDTQPADTQPQPDTSSDNSSDYTSPSDFIWPDFSPLPCEDQVPAVVQTPNAPRHLTAQALSSTSVYLAWQRGSTNEDGFEVARAGPDGVWNTVAKLPAGSTHFTDVGLSPGTTYTFAVVAVNSAGYSGYSNSASVMTLAGADPTLVGQFGHLSGSSTSAPLTFKDADGTSVTLSLNGPGSGALHRNPAGYAITLAGTTLASNFQMMTTKTGIQGDDGRFTLASLIVGNPAVAQDQTALGTLDARTTDLTGNLTITGTVRQITLGNIAGPDTLSIAEGGSNVSQVPAMTLTFGQVVDASLISGIGIQSLTATNWTAPGNPARIAAPYLNVLNITGRAATKTTPAISGDLGADLNLTGPTPYVGTNVLGSASVANQILGGNWTIAGAVGSVTARSAAGWFAQITGSGGNINRLTLSDATATNDLEITANSIPNLTVKGTLCHCHVVLNQPESLFRKALDLLAARTLRQTEIRIARNISRF